VKHGRTGGQKLTVGKLLLVIMREDEAMGGLRIYMYTYICET
jgi:hypothetical protein